MSINLRGKGVVNGEEVKTAQGKKREKWRSRQIQRRLYE